MQFNKPRLNVISSKMRVIEMINDKGVQYLSIHYAERMTELEVKGSLV